ncbi:hypothetical protein RFI_27705, partial [Reticulomyxa filosa]
KRQGENGSSKETPHRWNNTTPTQSPQSSTLDYDGRKKVAITPNQCVQYPVAAETIEILLLQTHWRVNEHDFIGDVILTNFRLLFISKPQQFFMTLMFGSIVTVGKISFYKMPNPIRSDGWDDTSRKGYSSPTASLSSIVDDKLCIVCKDARIIELTIERPVPTTPVMSTQNSEKKVVSKFYRKLKDMALQDKSEMASPTWEDRVLIDKYTEKSVCFMEMYTRIHDHLINDPVTADLPLHNNNDNNNLRLFLTTTTTTTTTMIIIGMCWTGMSSFRDNNASKFRSRSRLAVLSYFHHLTRSTIVRCAQPKRGVFDSESTADKEYFEAIRLTCGANAELVLSFQITYVIFNHKKKKKKKINEQIKRDTEQSHQVGIQTPKNILSGSLLVARRIVETKNFVAVIHCSDGWDRTSQISALSQLLVDPFYRTIRGFIVLIEKEWLAFGHRFMDRNGVLHKPKECSPIFLQFLECVWQVMQQFPNEFEFDEVFLVRLADHHGSNWFGNFLFNSEKERIDRQVSQKSISLWSWPIEPNENYNPDLSAQMLKPMITSASLQLLFTDFFLKHDDLSGQRDYFEKSTTDDTQPSTLTCSDCQLPFTFWRAQHKCRSCNGTFCGKCTVHKLLKNFEKPQRVCDKCSKT